MTSSNTIPDKATFLALAANGALGNQLRVWQSVSELLDDYSGQVVVRALDRQSPWMIPWTSTDCPCGCSGEFPCGYTGKFSTCVETDLAYILKESGLTVADFYFQEVPRRSTVRVANIEVLPEGDRHDTEMSLYIEHKTHEAVRGIRERIEPLYGPLARLTLRNAISEDSYDMLQDIWDNFPEAIIEATEFSNPCGTLNKRLVIWEVRHF